MKIFYSWQSDLDKKSNQYFLKDRLKEVIKGINGNLFSPVRLDHDTKNESGSPEIKQTIFNKIDSTDIFISDVSIINQDSGHRKSPNPNVLIELGYAIPKIGWSQIILLYNEHYGHENDLPFDIRGRRLVKYSIKPDDTKSKLKQAEIKEKLSNAIKAILFDLNHKQSKIKEVNDIEATIAFTEAIFDENHKYECNLKMSFTFANMSKLNLNNLVFETTMNGIKIPKLSRETNKVFYSGKPINYDLSVPLNDISSNLNFEVRYATDEVPFNTKKVSIQVSRENRIKRMGKAVASENYYKITEIKPETNIG